MPCSLLRAEPGNEPFTWLWRTWPGKALLSVHSVRQSTKETMSVHHYGTRKLSKRDFEVILRVAEGLKNRDVATALGTTEAVIKNYLRRIYDKLGVWNRVELALWYEARRHEEQQTNNRSVIVGEVPAIDKKRSGSPKLLSPSEARTSQRRSKAASSSTVARVVPDSDSRQSQRTKSARTA